ncbi:protein O-linked-mannose beta-1,4-N-acetylglucosaminyltransferase 2 [Octopus bimaculoides]|uniref:Glycosyltransferase 61 catalytic domain-containing protein n=1 Tax=Octopus bimaculoides TaxID=37653 RepID=A0A0L8I7K7_OCTBM|nr:protein O-linked-mannose beta-1,4-N-acetylglucosaminyltransferase 2 [Octopus bimaculoides]XP_014788390.1 protein O-linked-mannose beta-1,4-N-acetylglucosaminyltransferase 2 [Octopus bimaculoides]XP_052821571.1 protein O-linked-mannose beta-1,4-N-acetylglucosaminyltransferase 2 [Octopus bimaculoides]XP_052821576.1 protein O-linked-mannose beta-1,4-N-acetylglucosaminyltransferase 2 [Octopus bimaculoides]|eukprot:XP_014788384.1 PREDICTED: protein O-linked-mannose beta-1,4-N-acetylglucosaminyltransferase 2-like [Octopus bimaculoides]
MPSLHYISHAVALALIAMLIRKYIELKIYHDDVMSSCYLSETNHENSEVENEIEHETPPKAPVPTSDDPRFLTPEYLNQKLFSDGSSVTCNPTDHAAQRTCHFVNLCYFAERDSYLFFHSDKSILENIPVNRYSPTLVELSSVTNHTYNHFNYIDMPVSASRLFHIKWVTTSSLIIRRFKPDNLMHVIHDDILPLFQTLRHFNLAANTSDRFHYRLIFDDEWGEGPFLKLYDILSVYQPIFKSMLREAPGLTCFHQAYVGLVKSTAWYDYGFYKPQGPLPERKVSSVEINSLLEYTRRELGLSINTDNSDYLVLISRKSTRLILNEIELSLALSREVRIKVIHLSQEQYTIEQMIEVVSNSIGIIGMHGSLLTLAMYLPAGSILIELFPYAVNPDHYTPYKTLVSLPGMNILYRAWRNMEQKKSFGHLTMGNIEYLPHDVQQRIISQMEVPRHICCDDPSWLYHIYQDTQVDIETIISLTQEAILATKTENNRALDKIATNFVIPDKVTHDSCKTMVDGSKQIIIYWEIPWNLQFFNYETVEYEVLLQYTKSPEKSTIFRVSANSITLEPSDSFYIVWVRCSLDEIHVGPFKQIACVE